MVSRLSWSQQVNRAVDVEGISGAQALFFLSGTTTAVDVYQDADLTMPFSQPIFADADGVWPTVYVDGSVSYKVSQRDADGADLPGFALDPVVPISDITTAASIPFSPSESVAATNVQEAIEAAAALSTDQTDIIARYLTPYVTGGTSNAYTLTPSPAITAYASGQGWTVRPDRTNTAAATLNINGLGARNIKKTNSAGTATALIAGDIQAGKEFFAFDDGTQILMTFGRDLPIRTADANGDATIFSDGTLICRKSVLECEFLDNVECDGTWTFPRAFSTITGLAVNANLCPPTLSVTLSDVDVDCTPNRIELRSPHIGRATTTSVHVLVPRDSGGTDFLIGDKVYVTVTAIGRWF